jgi:hypothetical protein
MARFLCFNTQLAAGAAQLRIFEAGRDAFVAAGFTLDGSGNIIDRLRSRLTLERACRITRWDTPRQRLDGKWVIAHPADKGKPWTQAAAVLPDIITPFTVEEWSSSWWG